MKPKYKLLLIITTLFFIIMPRAQAAQVGTVTITGAVPPTCDIVVTPTAGASNIPDISIGATDKQVATVNENCNDPNGYTVTVAGTHSGNHTGLFVDSASSASLPFTISYNGANAPVGGVVTNATVPGFNLNKTVAITYSANNTLASTSGFTYAETLTFTITAK